MRDVVIVDAVRTAIGKRGRSLADVHPVDLSADVLTALVQRTGIDPAVVDDVIWGCVSQIGDQSSNIARFAVLAAGWPVTVPGTTINRACGSSQQAIDFAAYALLSGDCEVVIAGGVESMSRLPLGVTRSTGFPYGPRVMERFDEFSFNQGISAEAIAQKWALSRARLDEYASLSHQRADEAMQSGRFDAEIAPIATASGPFRHDEGVRPGTSPETLAKLPASFTDDGVIHAGNSSQISDGAAALLLMTGAKARELGLSPIARFKAGAVAGADPVLMLTAPIPATEKVLRRCGLSIDDIGVFEVNEAFAVVPLAWMAEVGADADRVNPVGGAIALGHPLGASGAILMTRMVHHMRRNDLRYGLQTMCEGGGTANATVVELVG
jgi:acetyl-CoA acyltransferase